jgi:hypothetical protein
MREVIEIEAPARGKVLDAVFVPAPRHSYGGTYLCEFKHGVVKEFRSFEGQVVPADDLVGSTPLGVRSTIAAVTREFHEEQDRRARRGSPMPCDCGSCGGSFSR